MDGPNALPEVSPSKQLDDNLFHDGQHPSFRAYLALAQNAIDQLRDRALFGASRGTDPHAIDPTECANHFGLDDDKRWAEVCRRAASFWGRLASSRYDDRARRAQFERLSRAAEAIEAGTAPEETGIPGTRDQSSGLSRLRRGGSGSPPPEVTL